MRRRAEHAPLLQRRSVSGKLDTACRPGAGADGCPPLDWSEAPPKRNTDETSDRPRFLRATVSDRATKHLREAEVREQMSRTPPLRRNEQRRAVAQAAAVPRFVGSGVLLSTGLADTSESSASPLRSCRSRPSSGSS